MVDLKETIIKNVIFHRYCCDDTKCIVNDSSYEYKNEEDVCGTAEVYRED